MSRYDQRGELAPRDVVSRAIATEMQHERATNVFLDVRHFGPGRFAERFPTIARLCRDFDIDPEQDLIPVRPSAHYGVGGIVADEAGETGVAGLLACGEIASTGLHGANRLASNSLLEGLVFGRRAGERAAGRASEAPAIDHPVAMKQALPASPRTELDLDDVRHSLQSIMSRNVGIERTGDRLREALEIIEFWSSYVLDKVFDEPSAWETQNLLTVAMCIAKAAEHRRESRGVHYRGDFPDTDAQWRRHVDIRRVDESIQLSTTAID
jgi:L-aspartate oxidase